jgi:hypothetical protein
MSGTRTIWFPCSDIAYAGVTGLASISARTASAPSLHPYSQHIVRYQKYGLLRPTAIAKSYQPKVSGILEHYCNYVLNSTAYKCKKFVFQAYERRCLHIPIRQS